MKEVDFDLLFDVISVDYAKTTRNKNQATNLKDACFLAGMEHAYFDIINMIKHWDDFKRSAFGVSEEDEESGKTCETCKYEETSGSKPPCRSCLRFAKKKYFWEKKEEEK